MRSRNLAHLTAPKKESQVRSAGIRKACHFIEGAGAGNVAVGVGAAGGGDGGEPASGVISENRSRAATVWELSPRRHRMDRVAYLTEFLPEIRIGLKQDFPWLTENRRRLVGGLDRSERDVPRSGEAR